MTLVEKLRAMVPPKWMTARNQDLYNLAVEDAIKIVEADLIYQTRIEVREVLGLMVDQWYVEDRDNVPDLHERGNALLAKLGTE